ncbi:hypothetical protein MNBD_PLANCTO02-573 [hydrothermal vent metagenome]|uniref:RNA polymerase sigma-70 region 2 domain-containing protein n=1 Tax=hydrothermal vent metagenome TaxID=652676 RepID=A0A3B1DXI6_9ZZZZ
MFTQYQRRLYLHILSQVASPVDAEEVLQETNVVIWRKYHQFEMGTNFWAWVCQISNYETLRFRSRKHRDKLRFSDQFVELIAEEAEQTAELTEQRLAALSNCMKKLREKDRQIIQMRYAPGANGKSTAETLGRPINSFYQSLGRIRRALLECIQREITTESS